MNLKSFDKENMFQVLVDFPEQIREACKIGEKLSDVINIKLKKVLILGMGGSAIGGDLLRNYFLNLNGAKHLQIIVNRDYDIPQFIDNEWLVIASSYSGNTEETLNAVKQAEDKTKNIVGITTGGKLAKFLDSNNFPKIILPKGIQPRAAIGYSFFPMLYLFMLNGTLKIEAVNEIAASINLLLELLEKKSKIYSSESEDNDAYIIARNVFKYMPIIYTSSKYEVINLRWRGQFQENANLPSYGNIIPEMNHNEINVIESEFLKSNYFFILKDNNENERTEKRFEFITNSLKENKNRFGVITPESKLQLTKYFELIYLGDWISYWAALMRNCDPTEIKNILKLKEFMAQ